MSPLTKEQLFKCLPRIWTPVSRPVFYFEPRHYGINVNDFELCLLMWRQSLALFFATNRVHYSWKHSTIGKPAAFTLAVSQCDEKSSSQSISWLRLKRQVPYPFTTAFSLQMEWHILLQMKVLFWSGLWTDHFRFYLYNHSSISLVCPRPHQGAVKHWQWNTHKTAVLCMMQNRTGASTLSLKNKAKSRLKFQTEAICDAKMDLNGTPKCRL